MSPVAIASSICALIAGVCFLPGLVAALEPRLLSPRSAFVVSTAGVTFLAAGLAFLLGAASLIDMAIARGRWTGYRFALIGVAAPFVLILGLLWVPTFGGVKSTDGRMTCGTNLSAIGKAMLIYANDYDDELPVAGGPSSQWTGRVADWAADSRADAYGLSPDGTGGQVSISAGLYLLVKYGEVLPKAFVCGGTNWRTREKGVREFRPGLYRVPNQAAELTDFWDFGPNPPQHCSYAYHMVYGPSRLTVTSEPAMAIAADRNPWMASPSAKAHDFSAFQPDIPPYNGPPAQARVGNTPRHDGEGQNVMFLDTHVEFEKRPYCGIKNDNIYTFWAGDDRIRGVPPQLGSVPADAKDSLLVNDPLQPSR